ncbi:NUDIX hydrolase [Dongia deserti]|uniref:NUDIX domain-containing protein n=1 Tax=Dongia deserti TaxID=2268030 RepID=UPI000E659BE6|nr:NUDIX domain-containing protein [Dongia deserti]
MKRETPVRPVDAAGLILLRGNREAPEILLGRRHAKTAFLPDIYVVPGGRVDPEDHLPSGFRERLHPAVAEALEAGNKRRPAIAFLRAALRELHEETGLILHGCGSGKPGGGAVWQAYAQAGSAPDFCAFDFLLRAITPVASRRRYNTRFFLADGSTAIGAVRGDGELLDLRWRKLSELDRLNIVDVTWTLIRLALARWRDRVPVGRESPKLLIYRNNSLILRALPAARRRA